MMKVEYIDFFKNRQRIRSEVAIITNALKEKIDGTKDMISLDHKNLEHINTMLPQMLECLKLQVQAFKSDNEQRELLNQGLKINDITNEGYLFFDSTTASRPKTPSNPTDSGIRFLHPDKPVADSYHGSLYLKELRYRNQDLPYPKAVTLMENMLASLEENIVQEPILFKTAPKRVFDDHYLENNTVPVIA